MGEWKVVKYLGKGQNGTVWEIGLVGGNERLVLKDLSEKEDADVENEVKSGERMQKKRFAIHWAHATQTLGPNSSRWKSTKQTYSWQNDTLPSPYDDECLNKKFKKFVLTSPVADSGTLEDFLETFLVDPRPPDKILLRMMGCLIIGLAMMHEARLWHYDIHAQNILVNRGVPLYNDFGLSDYRLIPGDSFDSITDYMNAHHSKISDSPRAQNPAPDIQDPPPEMGTKKDVFSLGGTLIDILAILTGDQDLMSYRQMKATRTKTLAEDEKVYSNVLQTLNRLQQDGKHPIFMDIVARMLDREPTTRLTSKQFALEVIDNKSDICLNCMMWDVRHSVGEDSDYSASSSDISLLEKFPERA